ncbi:MAG: PfkB family carbohydrate kinase [bacterium]
MKDIFDRINGLRALVVGDIILDHYIWGDATRISPEAPVPVIEISRDTYTAGGAANVAANVKALGAEAEIWGWIGRDKAGQLLRAILRRKGVVFQPDSFVTSAPTIQKTRVIVQHQQLCRLDREPSPEVYPCGGGRWISSMARNVRKHNVVILSDYAKGFLNDTIVADITESARKHKVFLALDPKPSRPLKFHGLDLITPNRKEALQLAGIRAQPHEKFPAKAVCRAIWQTYKPRYLVITMGEEGMLLSEKGVVTHVIPTVAREVYDVSGAGDTIIAALSLALASGCAFTSAAHFANAAAGVVIGKLGTATASPKEILSYISQQ